MSYDVADDGHMCSQEPPRLGPDLPPVDAALTQVCLEIADRYETDRDHVFCKFPPRLSIVQVVTRLKSISARALFAEFPQIKKELWGGELWAGSYS